MYQTKLRCLRYSIWSLVSKRVTFRLSTISLHAAFLRSVVPISEISFVGVVNITPLGSNTSENDCKKVLLPEFINKTHRWMLEFIPIQWNRPLLGLTLIWLSPVLSWIQNTAIVCLYPLLHVKEHIIQVEKGLTVPVI